MQKRVINPWKWQEQRSYVQAVDVEKVHGTLYISGQTAIDEDGVSSDADMRTQLKQAIANTERVILEAGYEIQNIVRLNIYTTASDELFANFDVFQEWARENNLQQASTVVEVARLFETLKVELEATVVK